MNSFFVPCSSFYLFAVWFALFSVVFLCGNIVNKWHMLLVALFGCFDFFCPLLLLVDITSQSKSCSECSSTENLILLFFPCFHLYWISIFRQHQVEVILNRFLPWISISNCIHQTPVANKRNLFVLCYTSVHYCHRRIKCNHKSSQWARQPNGNGDEKRRHALHK